MPPADLLQHPVCLHQRLLLYPLQHLWVRLAAVGNIVCLDEVPVVLLRLPARFKQQRLGSHSLRLNCAWGPGSSQSKAAVAVREWSVRLLQQCGLKKQLLTVAAAWLGGGACGTNSRPWQPGWLQASPAQLRGCQLEDVNCAGAERHMALHACVPLLFVLSTVGRGGKNFLLPQARPDFPAA